MSKYNPLQSLSSGKWKCWKVCFGILLHSLTLLWTMCGKNIYLAQNQINRKKTKIYKKCFPLKLNISRVQEMFHIQSSRLLSVVNFPMIVMEARLDPELYRTFAFFILVIAQSSSVWLSADKQPWECGDQTELMPGKAGTSDMINITIIHTQRNCQLLQTPSSSPQKEKILNTQEGESGWEAKPLE